MFVCVRKCVCESWSKVQPLERARYNAELECNIHRCVDFSIWYNIHTLFINVTDIQAAILAHKLSHLPDKILPGENNDVLASAIVEENNTLSLFPSLHLSRSLSTVSHSVFPSLSWEKEIEWIYGATVQVQ